MKSYLSIDLDYFGNGNSIIGQDKRFEQDMLKFMKKVFALNVPAFACTYHDDILADLNNYKVDKLYNIDFHSDITYEPKLSLDEGTWVNYYDYCDDCIFEWRYPDKFECVTQGMGICEWEGDGPSPWSKSKMPYKDNIRRQGLKGIDFDSVVAVGICLSPNWCDGWMWEYYKKWGFEDLLPVEQL